MDARRSASAWDAATPQNAHRVLQRLLPYVSRAVQTLTSLILVEGNRVDRIEEAASAIEVMYFAWVAWAQALGEVHRVTDPADIARLVAPPFESS